MLAAIFVAVFNIQDLPGRINNKSGNDGLHHFWTFKPVVLKLARIDWSGFQHLFRFISPDGAATDAVFNIACAVIAVQLLSDGVYIAMNGRIFRPDKARKNVAMNRFEDFPDSV